MTDTDDTAGLPAFTFNNRPLPGNGSDPARCRLEALERLLRDEGRWTDADVVGWLADDLDRLPARRWTKRHHSCPH